MKSAYNLKTRIAVVIAIMCIIFGFFSIRLIKLQIVEGAEYLEQSKKRVASKTSIIAPRGEIADRLGRPFVVNTDTKIIRLEKGLIKADKMNDMILELIKIFEASSDEYLDSLPISKTTPFKYSAQQTPDESSDKAIAELLKYLELSQETKADIAMGKLIEKYGLSDLSETDQRKIAGVRYEMYLRRFSDTNPYIFARDVNIQTVTLLKEKSEFFPGLSVDLEPVRQYVTPGIASHILGRIGQIYAEEYPELKKKGYSMNDIVGKEGIERSFEEYLKGTNGMKQIERDIDGKITAIKETKAAGPGNNVYLTLDKDLQTVAEESLERTIKSVAEKYAISKKPGYDANAGAAVAVNVNNGEILALASYPTFNLGTYNQDYLTLRGDKYLPMFNRALFGKYEPGSTFKMVTAIAGLESGVITPSYTNTCRGRYYYYAPSYTPTCYKGSVHGTINVSRALEDSCNIFFYELGRITGIDTMNLYARKLGLGKKTGIELGEAEGKLAGKQVREAEGKVWHPGDTIQAAIGQSENLFTPIQLASYISTIANGGTQYQLHILKSIKSYYYGETLVNKEPKVLDTIKMKPENYKAIVTGLKNVIASGTAASAFRDLKIPIAGKTGTAEVSKGSATGLFVGFAPADKPEIAVAVVIERAGLGGNVAPVAKDIFSAYFAAKEAHDKIKVEGVLIN